MRTSRALTLMFAALTFAACGSSKKTNQPDAHPTFDAPPPTPDAPTGVTGLGQVCNPQTTPSTCPTTAATCDALSATATTGWCTPGCGQTAWNAGNPTSPGQPGDTMCTTAYKGTTPAQGTPACVIYSQDKTDATKADWTCGILCGMYMTTNFGGCPGGLTCNATQNLCE
jgi:hypothetical protein